MFGNALTILLWVLHDKFGFGNKRLERLIDEINKFNEDFNAGLIDPKELIEQLEEETKIKKVDKLELNKNKSMITKSSSGINFLGHRFIIKDNKIDRQELLKTFI